MASSFIEFTKEGPFVALVWKNYEIYGRTAVAYGNNCMTKKTINGYREQFKEGGAGVRNSHS
jgi:hypothetical protein